MTSRRKLAIAVAKRLGKPLSNRKNRRRRQAARNGADHTTRTFKGTFALIPAQGVSVSNFVKLYVSLTSESANPQLSGLSEFNLWKGLYDRYRIKKVHMRVVPRVTDINQTAIGGGYNNGNGVYYVAADRQGMLSSSVPILKRRKGTRVIKETKPCSMSYSCSYPRGMWIDPSVSTPQTNILLQQIGANGGITLYAENLLEKNGQVFNYIWADVEVSWTVDFQTYNPKSLSVDGSNITLSTIETFDPSYNNTNCVAPLTAVDGSAPESSDTAEV